MKVYFIGIGGIGISSLARYYLHQGAEVLGSDLSANETTEELGQKGASVFIGRQQGEQLPADIDLVVYSVAVPSTNPEREKALQLQKENSKLEILSYPQALGKISRSYFTVAVSGVHGKSTTAAMISRMLIEAGLDPTIVIGTKMKKLPEKNFRAGKSQYLVLEADEWRASFLNYYPQVLVITSIEEEHLDFYHNLEDILQAYQKLLQHLPAGGILIINDDSPATHRLTIRPDLQVFHYSLVDPLALPLEKILKVPGKYNLSNALASFNVGRALKLNQETILQGLAGYKGCWRRFDQRQGKLGKKDFILVYDYAHHPTALKAFLQALRERFPREKILAIFQPHQYERTVKLFSQFVQVLKEADAWVDQLIITDIYKVAGREKRGEEKIKAETLVQTARSPSVVFQSLGKLGSYLQKELEGGEVVAVIGAGDIYDWGKTTLEKK